MTFPIEIHKVTQTDQRFFITWALGNTCTYSCSYCPTIFHNGSHKYHDKNSIIRILQNINKPTVVIFTGGEPTYHPNFEEILDEIPNNIKVHIISNASRPLAFWKRILPKFQGTTLTYHAEFAIRHRFIEIASTIRSKLSKINLTMNPILWDECVSVYYDLLAHKLPVTPKVLIKNFGFQAKGSYDYTEQQQQWIKNNVKPERGFRISMYNDQGKEIGVTTPGEILINNNSNFSDWSCDAPLQLMNIDFNGNIYDSSCKQRNKLGHIDTGYTIPIKPMICKTNFCWCFSDIGSTKTRIK